MATKQLRGKHGIAKLHVVTPEGHLISIFTGPTGQDTRLVIHPAAGCAATIGTYTDTTATRVIHVGPIR